MSVYSPVNEPVLSTSMSRISLPLAALCLVAAACSSDTTSPSTTAEPIATTTAPTVDATTTTTDVPTRPPACDTRWERVQAGLIESTELTEISGAAVSSKYEDTIWLHNDSGDDAVVYAVDPAGTDLAQISLPDLSARDWEDMAIGPGPEAGVDYLYLGDIGDNNSSREEVVIHRIPEPEPVSGTLDGGETLRVTYPLGPMEAETLLVDPVTGEILIVGKALSGVTTVYGLSGGLDWSIPHEATYLGEIALGTFALATGGDAGTQRIVVRTYDEVFMWERRPGDTLATALLTPPCRVASIREEQGEAIALTPNEQGFYTASEGVRSPLSRYFEPTGGGS